MRAVVFDKELKLIKDYPMPVLKEGEALVKVILVGICNTDVEITKGYMGFSGVIGHEFVGEVVEIRGENQELLGKRVVGEINLGCGNCEWCAKGLQRHCYNRSVLGIFNRDGCMADYVSMPIENLLVVDDNIPDEEAIFTEPIAAAFEILEQKHIQPNEKIAVLGDGKLGLLISIVLSYTQAYLTVIGKHEEKLKVVEKYGIKTALLKDLKEERVFDTVVDATGSVSGLECAMKILKPRGVLVLKSTVATGKDFNISPFVVDEIAILGSRCGRFEPALRLMKRGLIDTKPFIEKIFDADNAIEAFELSRQKGILKVILKFD